MAKHTLHIFAETKSGAFKSGRSQLKENEIFAGSLKPNRGLFIDRGMLFSKGCCRWLFLRGKTCRVDLYVSFQTVKKTNKVKLVELSNMITARWR